MSVLFQKSFSDGLFEVHDQKPSIEMRHVRQTHSTIILQNPINSDIEADGIVILKSEQTPIAIKTADCLPILINGEEGVALIHAGWRGLADGILGNPIIRTIKPQSAFIGPCIHECCFEVTAEFQAHFPHQLIRNNHFNLVSEAMAQIKTHYQITAVDSQECTCCSKKYHSFRRDKTSQRIWNLFIPQAQ
jgi:polyphenol oxidase